VTRFDRTLARTFGRAAAVAGIGLATVALAAPGDRIALLDASDADYRALAPDPAVRTAPDEPLRLVVVRGGTATADHGLARRVTDSTERAPNGALLRNERTARDEAWISEDATVAVVARERSVVVRELDARGDAATSGYRVRRSEVDIAWYDVDHPDGRWRVELGDGRRVGAVELLDSGAAVAVTVVDGDACEFRVYADDGRELLLRRDLVPTSPEIRVGANGRMVAIDLAFASRPGLPDRAITVLHLLSGDSWTYAWNYGSDQEPLSWEFEEDGALEVVTVDAVYRYAPNGRPLGGKKRR